MEEKITNSKAYAPPRLDVLGNVAKLTATGSGQNPENQAQQENTRQRP